MKINLQIIALAFLFNYNLTQAQNDNSFLILLSVNSDISVNGNSGSGIFDQGFTFGAGYNYSLQDYNSRKNKVGLSLSFEAQYTNLKFKQNNEKSNLSKITVPINFNFQFFGDKEEFFYATLFGGPYAGYLLDYKIGDNSIKDNLTLFDYGYNIGAQLMVLLPLYINYQHSLANLSNNENKTIKHSYITFGFRYNI